MKEVVCVICNTYLATGLSMCVRCSKSWNHARRKDDGTLFAVMTWAARRARNACRRTVKAMETIRKLERALEAGVYNTKPDALAGGSALKLESLSPTMKYVTFKDKHIKLKRRKQVAKRKAK